MENLILISYLNDYIFCPVSIYFHNLYGAAEQMLYQGKHQIEGKAAHKAIDNHSYSTSKNILTGISVYSEKYALVGKIDIYDQNKKTLMERKKRIKTIYDGYIFQLYAQYYCMEEMGYKVKHLKLYSMDDNKSYPVLLPTADFAMSTKFDNIVYEIQNFDFKNYVQTNKDKCKQCIYEPICDRGLK